MGSHNFRSVGTTTDAAQSALPKTATPIGIRTPLESGDGELFKMHYDLKDVMRDNFRNLVLTNWGERLGLYDFGANLRPSLAEWASLEDFDAVAQSKIADAVARWMPYVSLGDYESHLTSNGGNVLLVSIKLNYDIPSIDATGMALEVTLQVM